MTLASLYVTTLAACAVLGLAAWGLGRHLEGMRARRRADDAAWAQREPALAAQERDWF